MVNKTSKEKKIEYRQNFREYIKLSDDRVLDTKKYGVELLGSDEIFVQLKDTNQYWISNYGRLVNNMRKDKSFRFHKMSSGTGKRSVHWTVVLYEEDGTPIHIETNPEQLVAEYFLLKKNGYTKIWHIDEDVNNNHYKNLIYVTAEEYRLLSKQVLSVSKLGREQEYHEYNTVKGNPAYNIWNGIYARCYGSDSMVVNRCYRDAFMCEEWKNDRDAFAEWYSTNYYECDGEVMAVDKDLLCRGNKEYAPDKCCLLPQTINSVLASATKRRSGYSNISGKKPYPIGVGYDNARGKFYARITPFNHDKQVKLHYWDTEDEAFQEYKLFKESEIRILAARYRDKIPDHIFDALVNYEVRPYSPYEE
jgi:hypothetical protein